MDKQTAIEELQKLSEDVPLSVRVVYFLCLELKAIEQAITSTEAQDLSLLLDRARDLRKTLVRTITKSDTEEHFRSYLVENGLVTPLQIKNALEYQGCFDKPLGQVACEQKMLNSDQVFEILGIQAESGKMFGTIAVERGYLSNEQVEQLVDIQMEHHIPIGQLLVSMGALTPEELKTCLENFLVI